MRLSFRSKKALIFALATVFGSVLVFFTLSKKEPKLTLTIGFAPNQLYREIALLISEQLVKENPMLSVSLMATTALDYRDSPVGQDAKAPFDCFVGDALNTAELDKLGVLQDRAKLFSASELEKFPIGDSLQNAMEIGLTDIPFLYQKGYKEKPKDLFEVFRRAGEDTKSSHLQFRLFAPLETGYVPLALLANIGGVSFTYQPRLAWGWRRDKVTDLASLLLNAVTQDLSMPSSCHGECAVKYFQQMPSGFFLSGNWRLRELQSKEVQAIPLMDIGKSGVVFPSTAAYVGFTKSVPQKAALAFLEAAFSENVMPRYQALGGFLRKDPKSHQEVMLPSDVAVFRKLQADIGAFSVGLVEAKYSVEEFTEKVLKL